jgi:hypothetical protein
MPLARQTARQASLAQMLGIEPEVGQEPSSLAFNNAIPPSIEKQREAAVLASMDARTNASMARDLEEANAVRAARNMGFEGSYPIREQNDYAAQQKLAQILLPKQYELAAADKRLQQQQAFDAAEGERNRAASMERVQAAQGGQNNRVAAQQAAITARANQQQQNKRGALGRAWDWMTGGSQPVAPASAPSGPVIMMDPNSGETRQVPAEMVEQYLSRGAVVVR